MGGRYRRKVGGDVLITIYHYSGGVSVTRQVSAPAGELTTGVRQRPKADAGTAFKGIGKRVGRRSDLVYLYNTTIWADIHGQLKTFTWSASLGWLCVE